MNKTDVLGEMVVSLKVETSSTEMGWKKQSVNVNFDFTGCTLEEVLQWAGADRRIALQRPARGLGLTEYMKLEGQTIHARDVGKKIESEEVREVRRLTRLLMAKKNKQNMSIEKMEELIDEM